MKWRKFLALVLSAALCVGVGVPAVGAGVDADQQLMAVTAKVKATLDLDTELYTDFHGWANEDLLVGNRWNLQWSGDGISMSILADDSGKIYSFNRYESASVEPLDTKYFYGGTFRVPALPVDQSQEALAAAQAFLDKVLTTGLESVTLEDNSAPSLYRDSYHYNGEIKLNGLSSPIACSITVRAGDLAVTRFWRNDQYSAYFGALPAAQPRANEAQGRRSLGSIQTLEAKYVLQADGTTAKVMYVPQGTDDYYVDGQSGDLVNLTELREKMRGANYDTNNKYSVAAAAAPEASLATGLTQAEKDGAAILAGAMSKEALDKVVRSTWPELGLTMYTLMSGSFSINEKDIPLTAQRTPEDYNVTCRLVYTCQNGSYLSSRYVTVDAKTGELKGLWSTRTYEEGAKPTIAVTANNGVTKGADFLKLWAPDNFAKTELTDTQDAKDATNGWMHTYTYQHTAFGYHYPGNYFTVGVDAMDGSIASISSNFDEDVELIDPVKVVSPAAAKEAYVAALPIEYGYYEVPVEVNGLDAATRKLLQQAGYTYVLSLKNGYKVGYSTPAIQGVDAVTGEVVYYDAYTPDVRSVTYSDVEGHWVQEAAEALAVFNVGFLGGKLEPGKPLTQLDMIILLSSLDGYLYDPASQDRSNVDWLYQHAYALGICTPAERNESKAIARGELVKLILDAAGYKKIAAIPGIFRCSFTDAAAMDDATIGYAALAQGLGLVKGGSDGAYAANREATRAEAVAMLYQYMK